MQKKKIVTISGGNGGATTIQALKENKELFDITAIINATDSGGSSGRLREEFNTLPAGDILRATLAMSGVYDYKILKELFYKKRYSNIGKLDNHNLGNLFLVLSAQYAGDFVSAISALEQSVEAVGHVYPVTLGKAHLVAELENGDIVHTEAEIDRPSYDRRIKIKKLRLDSSPEIYPPAATAIEEADYIIFGPGSLYCSVIATMLPTGFIEAVVNSKAKLIYLAGSKYELDGETGPTTLCDSLYALEEYLPRRIDTVIFNKHSLNDKQKEYYREKKWGSMEFDPDCIKGPKIVAKDFEKEKGGLDVELLGVILKEELV